MTVTKRLADGLSVSTFIRPEQLSDVAGAFRTIINNRPDGEEPGQPTSAELAETAGRLGLHYIHIPVVPGRIEDEQVRRFADALATSPQPVLAFCRTGTRSTTLWALSQAGKRNPRDIIATAGTAGYDLSALQPKLEGQEQQS